MRRIKEIIQVGIAAGLVAGSLALGWSAPTKADTANVPSLVISQLKITSSNGQFITLYNSTSAALDMSKYQLEYFNNYDLSKATSSKLVGLSGVVPPHGYFMVNDGSLLLCYQLTVDSVSLGLSSTAGLVEVLDPFGNSIDATDIYGTAKDGQAWALANGKWYWTTRLTPNAANIINQPPASKKVATKTAAKSKASKATAKAKAGKTGTAAADQSDDDQPSTTPIHLWTLALVGAAALLYGLYEYRADLANRIYQFRGYLRTRREDRA